MRLCTRPNLPPQDFAAVFNTISTAAQKIKNAASYKLLLYKIIAGILPRGSCIRDKLGLLFWLFIGTGISVNVFQDIDNSSLKSDV